MAAPQYYDLRGSSKGQWESNTNRENALWDCGTSGWESCIALPRVNISVIFWFYHCVCGWMEAAQQFCCCHIFYFMFIFSLFKMLALSLLARRGRHLGEEGLLYGPLQCAFVLNSGAVGLVSMGDSCYDLLGQVTKFHKIFSSRSQDFAFSCKFIRNESQLLSFWFGYCSGLDAFTLVVQRLTWLWSLYSTIYFLPFFFNH